LLQSPPAALRQGIARKAVDHVDVVAVQVVEVKVLAPVAARGPQTGNRAGGCRPCSRSRCICSCSGCSLGPCSHPITQSPPAALSQGIAWEAVDHEVVVDVLAIVVVVVAWVLAPIQSPKSPPAALSQRIARAAVDHEVVVEVLAPSHHPRPSDRKSRGRLSTM
jgi:hypothetical protein